MAEVVGKVSVKVWPDTDGFAKDAKYRIEQQLKRMSEPKVRLQGVFSSTQIALALREALLPVQAQAKNDPRFWIKLRTDVDDRWHKGNMAEHVEEWADAFRDLEQASARAAKAIKDNAPKASDFDRYQAWQQQSDAMQPPADFDHRVQQRTKRLLDGWNTQWATGFADRINIDRDGWRIMRAQTQRNLDGLIKQMRDYSKSQPFWHEIQLKSKRIPGTQGLRTYSLQVKKLATLKRKAAALVVAIDKQFSSRDWGAAFRKMDANLGSGLRGSRMNILFRQAGARAALAFGDGLRRLSGMRLAGDLARDTWEPLANFDKHLPKLVMGASAFTTIASSVGALSSNLLSLGGDIGRIVPMLLAVPGVFASAGVGIAALIVGLQGMKDFAPQVGRAYAGFGESMQRSFWGAAEGVADSLIAVQGAFRDGMMAVSRRAGFFVDEFLKHFERLSGPHLGLMFDGVVEGFKQGERGAAAFAGVITNFGLIGAEYFPRLSGWITDISRTFDRWLDRAVVSGRAFEWIDLAVERMRDLGSVVSAAGGLLRDLVGISDRAGGAMLSNLADGLNGLRYALRDGGRAATTMEQLFRGAHKTVEAFSDSIGPGLGNFLESMGKIAEEVGPKLSAAFGGVVGALLDGFSAPGFSRATRVFADNVTSLAGMIKPVAKQSSELVGIFDTLNAAIEPFGRLGVTAVGGILLAIDELGPSLVNTVTVLGGAAADLAETVFEPLTKTVANLGPVLEAVAAAVADIATRASGPLNGLMSTIDALATSIGGLIRSDGFAGLASIIGDLAGTAIEFADAVLRIVDAAVKFAGTGFVTMLSNLLEVADMVANVLTGLADVVAGLAGSFGVAATEGDGFANAVGDIAGAAVGAGAVAVGVGALSSKAKGAGKAVGDAGGKAKGASGAFLGLDKSSMKLAGKLAIVSGLVSASGWGESTIRSAEEMADVMRDTARGVGTLDDAFRGVDGGAISADLFGLKKEVFDLDSALRGLDAGWFGRNVWSGNFKAASEAFDQMDVALQNMPLDEAARMFSMLQAEIAGTGRDADIAREQMSGYADMVERMLVDAGLGHYVEDQAAFAAILAGDLPDGLLRTETGFISALDAAKAFNEELRADRIAEALESGIGLIPQYAQRSMNDAVAEIRSGLSEIGDVFVDNAPSMMEFWTQLGGGGPEGAALARENLDTVTGAFAQAEEMLEGIGISVAEHGGSIAEAMRAAAEEGGAQAEAAAAAQKIVADALEETGLSYEDLKSQLATLDLAPEHRAAMEEILAVYEAMPGHMQEVFGAGGLEAHNAFKAQWAAAADGDDPYAAKFAQDMLDLAARAEEAGIYVQDLQTLLQAELQVFGGDDPFGDLSAQMQGVATEGETLRTELAKPVEVFGGIDPYGSFSEQYAARAKELAADLRTEVATPLPQMPDPTEPMRAGMQQTVAELEIVDQTLTDTSHWVMPDVTGPLREGAAETKVQVDGVAEAIARPELQQSGMLPNIFADQTTGAINLTEGARGLRGAVEKAQEQLAPGLPSTGVDDAAALASAFGDVSGTAGSMSSDVQSQSLLMSSVFSAQAGLMASVAAVQFLAAGASAGAMALATVAAGKSGAGAMGEVGEAAKRMARNVGAGSSTAVSTLRGMSSAIRGSLGNAGGLLVGAGSAVMNGLIRGINSQRGALRRTLASITAMIPANKGPISKDRQLLRPAGAAIMEGLSDSMWDSFQRELRPTLQKITREIEGTKLEVPSVRSAGGLQSAHGAIGEPVRAGGGNTVNVNVHNPRAEKTSDTTRRALGQANVLLGVG